jgi:hypothetical protein
MAAFSVFFMQSPSFLAHQEALAAGRGRSNCQTLFGMAAIPSDNHIRQMLDGCAPGVFDGVFLKAVATVQAADGLKAFRRLGDRVLVALDGTEHFRSSKIHCPQCSRQQHTDGKLDYHHAFLGATLVAPGHSRVLPLPPEFLTPQDGTEKQDCERAAAKRWLSRHGTALAPLRPVYLGDDLYACQPVAEAIQASGGAFILTCKPSSHKTIAEYLAGAELNEHRQTVHQPGKKSAIVYRWMNEVPLRNTKDALIVNWFSIEIFNGKGKRTYHNSFITDLTVTTETVAELADCGRARWKIENETFNVLKTGGYNLEHNFGHGKKTLANLLVVLNLLAFSFHAVALYSVLAWRNAVAARGASYRFFEHLLTITAYIIFPDWEALLVAITDPNIRPP